MTKSNEKVALFVDGPEFYSTARSLQFDIDYKALKGWAAELGSLVRAHYFTLIDEENDHNPIVKMTDWLDYNGWSVVTRSAVVNIAADGKRQVKGNMQVELAVAAIDLSPHVDHIIVGTGNRAFVPLVESLQRRGSRVSVLSTIKATPAPASDELRRQADQFIDLADLKDVISRPVREFAG